MAREKYKPEIIKAYFKEIGLPEPVFEFVYIPNRKFRLDIAFPEWRVGLEVQGGLFIKAAHSTGAGIRRDMEKRNLGILEGWSVLECEPENVCMAETAWMIKMALQLKGWKNDQS